MNKRLNKIGLFQKTVFLTATFVFVAGGLCAQQTQTYTQYMFDRYLFNPAACGANGLTTISLVVKDQWTGFKGAPSNQMLSFQARMPKNGRLASRGSGGFSLDKIGMGITLFNDIRGPIRTTGGHIAYAYHLENNSDGQFSFGLGIKMFQLFLDRNRMTTADEDIFLNGTTLSTFVPDANFGLHYATEKFYVGASVMDVFQSFLMLGGKNSSSYRIERQYNILGGYIFALDEYWSLVPTALIKGNDRLVMQADVNTMLYYNDEFWGGLAYRTGGGGIPGSVSILFGARFRQYFFGYAFDYSFGRMNQYSYGSHELMATISFGANERFFRFHRRYNFKETKPGGRTLF